MSTGSRRLKMAISPLAHHAALIDRRVKLPGAELVQIESGSDQAEVFKRMCRNLEFDICELSVMSYYCAVEYGLPICGIPVVPRHTFHHGDFLKHVDAGIESPKDLEGKRVGTRTYTVTPGVLDRGILTEEFGVDTDTITWVLAEQEHVAQVEDHYPRNVVPGKNEDLFPRLASGDLNAGIAGSNLRRSSAPSVAPLFPEAYELDRRQYERQGFLPAFSCIVVKSHLVEEDPSFLERVFDAFVAAREFGIQPNEEVAEIAEKNPVPIGLRANRDSLEELVRLGVEQHILSGRLGVDDFFPSLDPG